ncbi:MAG: hypothetical protein CR986_10480 [Ignavibacteriae bacterium]|nr:MAG: hypothetical protein CR986_10480 [Ignavibacteriota bacterium]
MNKILQNKNIVLTRSKEQSKDSEVALKKLGANVILFPTIKITEVADNLKIKATLKNINHYDIIVFTSENSVKFFSKKIAKKEFNNNKYFFISIGSKTSKVCEEYGYKVNFQPSKFTADILLNELKIFNIKKKKILIPCSILSNKKKYKQIEKYGAEVDVIPFYKNEVNDKDLLKTEINYIKTNYVDFFIFTSPSTFYSFTELLKIDNPKSFFFNKNIAVIGPTTERAIKSKGIKVTIKPNRFTMESLIEEIVKFHKTNSNKR